MCCLLGTASCCCPPSSDAVPGPRGAPRAERTASHWRRCRASMCRALYVPRYSTRTALAGRRADRQRQSRPVGQARPGEAHPQATRCDHARSAWPSRSSMWSGSQLPGAPCRFCRPATSPCRSSTPSLDDGLIPAVEKGLVATPAPGAAEEPSRHHSTPSFRPTCLSWLEWRPLRGQPG